MNDYFEKILQAEVYEVAKKTPLEKAHNLSNTLNNEVFLKREDLQDVFSFKIRGAYNKMSKLSNSQLAQGVITSSAGNHAQGVALSALKLNCQATILMPITTPLVKVNAVKNLKAKVILYGDNYDEKLAPMILAEYGNVASAGSVIAFNQTSDDFISGDKGVICSFGAGYSICSLVVEKV